MSFFSDLTTTTIGAFIGGLFSYLIVRIQLREKEKDKMSEQASKVATWLTGITMSANIDIPLDYVLYDVVINNNSNLPIYNVLVLSLGNRSQLNYKDIEYQSFVNYYPILVPGETKDTIGTNGSALGIERPATAILFTDSQEQYWYRNQVGKLDKLTEQEYDKLVVTLGYRPPL